MKRTTIAVTGAALLAAGALPLATAAASAAPSASKRLVVSSASHAEYLKAKAAFVAKGGKVIVDLPGIDAFVTSGSTSARSALPRSAKIAADGVRSITNAERTTPTLKAQSRRTVALPASAAKAANAPVGDPAMSYNGLLWDFFRMGVPAAWKKATGAGVTVGVADTGIDFTHPELRSKVKAVYDVSDPTLCKDYFDASDDDLAKKYGGPANGDWNGHGSWIAGDIAGALDGVGMNGIAPGANLVALKISGWCGYANDTDILNAITTAADKGVNVVNISFGGYLDRSDPEQDAAYKLYVKAVAYAKSKGTIIVASAGNESARLGLGGKVLSHGTLNLPGDKVFDAYGLYEVPGGVPGVVNVAAVGNVTVPASKSCIPGTEGSPTATAATCKPLSDYHDPIAPAQRDQLAYYSNYGPDIDVAAYGGARKFNLPVWDRGGTPGFPVTADDLTNAYETFSVTSNWALEIPCYIFTPGSGFYTDSCYSTIQGTSMAAPHAVGALALILSANPGLKSNVDGAVAKLKSLSYKGAVNRTTTLSPGDKSKSDLTQVACPSGFCHLSKVRIGNGEAYGAGIVNVAKL